MEPDPQELPALIAGGRRSFHFADIERFRAVRARDAVMHYGECARSRCADAYAAASTFMRSSVERERRDSQSFMQVLQRSQRDLTAARCLRDLMITAIDADRRDERAVIYRELLADVDEAIGHVEALQQEMLAWAAGAYPGMSEH